MELTIAEQIAEHSWRKPVALFKNYVGFIWHSADTEQYRKALKRNGNELVGIYHRALPNMIREDLEFASEGSWNRRVSQ